MEQQKKKKDILLSIVIPVYNVSKYISKCLDSIISQNEEDYEIILVDDGSTDESGKICDHYSQKYHNIITIHTNNNGVSSARNNAIEYVRGKYIWFVDSDDYINNDLHKILQELKTTDLDILLIDLEFVDINGIKLHSFKSPYKRNVQKIINGKICLEKVLRSFYVFLFIIKKDLIMNHRFNERLKIYEDLALIPFLILEAERIKKLSSSCSYYYVQRNTSALHSYNKLYLDNIMEIILYFDYFIKIDSKYASLYPIQLYLVRSLLVFLTKKEYSDRKTEFLKLLKKNNLDKLYLQKSIVHRIINFTYRHFQNTFVSFLKYFLYILEIKKYLKQIV